MSKRRANAHPLTDGDALTCEGCGGTWATAWPWGGWSIALDCMNKRNKSRGGIVRTATVILCASCVQKVAGLLLANVPSRASLRAPMRDSLATAIQLAKAQIQTPRAIAAALARTGSGRRVGSKPRHEPKGKGKATRECQECGKPLVGGRGDRRWCSRTCTQRAYRARREARGEPVAAASASASGPPRLCAVPGCGKSLAGRHPRARYCSHGCANRGYYLAHDGAARARRAKPRPPSPPPAPAPAPEPAAVDAPQSTAAAPQPRRRSDPLGERVGTALAEANRQRQAGVAALRGQP